MSINAIANGFVVIQRRFVDMAGQTLMHAGIVLAAMWASAFSVSAQNPHDGFKLPELQRHAQTATANRGIVLQADGKVWISGHFEQADGVALSGLARLHADGSLDLSFRTPDSLSDAVLAMAPVAEGKLLIGGRFTNTVGERIARLNADGSVDTGFDAGAGANGDVSIIVPQPDGKAIVVGAFSAVDGQPRNRIARLNADGSLDTGFDPGDVDNTIASVALQTDGKLLIGGDFAAVGGQPRSRIARLNTDGTLDVTFDTPTGANGTVRSIAVQPDGKIVLGGDFTSVGHSVRSRIARLDVDGSVDAGFQIGSGADSTVRSIVQAADGKLLIGGSFLSIDGQPRTRVARLNMDGSLDDGYSLDAAFEGRWAGEPDSAPGSAGPDGIVNTVFVQQDGKLLIHGVFVSVSGNAFPAGVARLNVDGTPDSDIVKVSAVDYGGTGAPHITVSTIQPDGKLLISGGFGYVQGVPRFKLARLHPDGSLDIGFNAGNGPILVGYPPFASFVHGLAAQVDGKVLVGGVFTAFADMPRNYVARLNADGSLDESFDSRLTHLPGWEPFGGVNTVAVQPDGMVLLGGVFRTADATQNGLIRVHPDGSVDPTFDADLLLWEAPPPGGVLGDFVNKVLVQRDGRILFWARSQYEVGGDEITTLRRLNADGSPDPAFDIGQGPNGPLAAMHLQPDGKVLISGAFTEFDGRPRSYLARLNADGSLDESFDSVITIEQTEGVRFLALQPDGKLLLSPTDSNGLLTVGGIASGQLARLNSDGSLDTGFGSSYPRGIYGGVATSTIQSDGKISVFGDFHQVDDPAVFWPDSVRYSVPQAGLQFVGFSGDSNRVDWLRSGSGPEFWGTTFEVSVDGETWHSLGAGEPIPGGMGRLPAAWKSIDAVTRPAWSRDQAEGIQQPSADDETGANRRGIPTAGAMPPHPGGVAGRIAGLMRMASLAAVGDASDSRSDETVEQTSQPRSRYAQAARYTAAASLADLSATQPSGAGAPQVVISQIFTGGGGVYSHDYIELFNAGDGPQDLSGWSVQHSLGRTSETWIGTDLTGIVLNAGEYYLVQGAQGGGAGAPLPSPDAIGDIDLGTVQGRVALMASNTLLTEVCPASSDIVDFLGYDSITPALVCAWGSGSMRPSSNALLRLDDGCRNSNNNSSDFVIGPPDPRNTESTRLLCHERPSLVAVGGTPQVAEAGGAFAEPLAVRVTDTNGSPVQGIEISFAVPASGASALLSSSTAVTDMNGEASVTAAANSVVGSYLVYASIPGRDVGFHLTNRPPFNEKIVISQVWGGGGLNGAPYTHDFVELFNAGDQPVDITSWFFRWYYPSAWRGAVLPAAVLQPGQYYLIQLGSSSPGAGAPLPQADLVITGSSTNFSPTVGKITLLRSAGSSGGECPTHVGAVDLVGYGNQADCAWAAPALASSAQIATMRADGGCRQTGNNAADFVGGAPQPRNSASPLNPCVGGVDLRIESIGGTPQTAAIGQSFGTPLTARVTDADGDPVAGETVTFVLPATSDATATPASVTATTDGSGEAQIAVTANSVTGSYHARAYTMRSGPPATFALANAALNLEIVSGNSQSAELNEPFAEPLVVRVTDNGSGLPVENAAVTFSTPSAGAGAVLSATTVATNASGEASVTASANSAPGTYSVTATIGTMQVGFDLTNTVPTHGPRVVISQIYRGNESGSGSPHRNFIELFNAGTEYESLHGWSVQSRNENGGGIAITPLPGIALQPGQRLLIGYLAGGDAGATLPPPDVIAAGGEPEDLVALASDLDPLTGECPAGDPSVVDFVGTGFVDCAWGTPVSTPPDLQALIRNENGCAQTANNAVDFSAGNPQPRNSTAPFTPCDGSGPGEIDVAILSGDNQSIRLNRLFTQPLRVRLTRDGGTPVVGQAVSYLTLPSAAGATAALSSTTVVTNSSGEASVTATSNAVVGSHVVRAVVGLTHIDFDLTNLGQVVVRSFPVQSAPLNSPFRDIRVQVNYGDSSDELPDIPVQFSVPSGGATALLSATTVITDSNGEAVVRAAANGMPGSYQVTASIAGSAPPVTINMTNIDPGSTTQPWDGWSISDVNLPRNRNVWIRVRGFTTDGSIHESVKVFYPTVGFTATPAAGEGGRIEPPIPQGGEAGNVLSFTIVPDEGFGIASVSGCDGSLNGSTYLTGPLSADCEIEAVFTGDVETFTVTASAGPGGSIEPDGAQSVTEGETVSFVLLPDVDYVIDTVGGTCGGALVDDIFTTAPVTADCTVEASFEPEQADDVLFADGFEGEGTTP